METQTPFDMISHVMGHWEMVSHLCHEGVGNYFEHAFKITMLCETTGM